MADNYFSEESDEGESHWMKQSSEVREDEVWDDEEIIKNANKYTTMG